jgi:hypothetical protein
MPQEPQLQLTERSAGVVHKLLVVAVVMMVLVIAALRPAFGFESAGQLTTVFRVAAVGVLLVSVFAMRVVRSGMAPVGRSDDRDAWWRANFPRAIVVWALAEGSALAGTVFWVVTGDFVILAVVTGVSLALMVLSRPAALGGR